MAAQYDQINPFCLDGRDECRQYRTGKCFSSYLDAPEFVRCGKSCEIAGVPGEFNRQVFDRDRRWVLRQGFNWRISHL
ncbi:MAG TPA: hypothetical protein VKB35_02845 [Ktedonobacteraceae bacterium]|nr:hypothetical protein [Ktedonobacteraceae bacterium]